MALIWVTTVIIVDIEKSIVENDQKYFVSCGSVPVSCASSFTSSSCVAFALPMRLGGTQPTNGGQPCITGITFNEPPTAHLIGHKHIGNVSRPFIGRWSNSLHYAVLLSTRFHCKMKFSFSGSLLSGYLLPIQLKYCKNLCTLCQ